MHFPRSCLHCETPACVTVCPTGASYKRASDGIVLVDEDKCIGCKLCSWACPYGAREFDTDVGVMKKCTLCIDRIYNDNLAEEDRVPACVAACPTGARHFGDLGDPHSPVSQLVAERGGVDLMPELGYRPDQQIPAAARPYAARRVAWTRGARAGAGRRRLPRLGRPHAFELAMHPAFSVIFFTTATGAGYGLLALLGVLGGARTCSRPIAGSASSASGWRLA